MEYKFIAEIYKVGINPCVEVPLRITKNLLAKKGYIAISGKINGHSFQQHLVPVKDGLYRLYVNGPMLKGGNTKVGQKAKFEIEQFTGDGYENPMPDVLLKRLTKEKLLSAFNKLVPSRQKEVNRYIGHLKTKEAIDRNLDKVMTMLKEGRTSMW